MDIWFFPQILCKTVLFYLKGLPSEVPSEQVSVKKSKFRQSQEQKTKLSKDAAFDPEEEMDSMS